MKKPGWKFFALVALGCAVFAAGIGAAVHLLSSPKPNGLRGIHQAGIAEAQASQMVFAAFDLSTQDPDQVRSLFKEWTRIAGFLEAGQELPSQDAAALPPEDTGETGGAANARVRLAFGFGPSLFDGRFGLAGQRPAALVDTPRFPGDQLDEAWTGGDLGVQIEGEDFQSVYHALHTLARASKGLARVRWVQAGFAASPQAKAGATGRNLQGFKDGTVNPDTSRARDMDAQVWVGADQGPGWMEGGSYLVVRKIRMLVEVWDRSSLKDQEQTIGRHRATGAALGHGAEKEAFDPASLPAGSHVRVAKGDGTQPMYRRAYSYFGGLDSRTGQWDAGLFFMAWQKDPRKQFIPVQERLSAQDSLNEYIQTTGSAVFAFPPGLGEGEYLGQALFPDMPLDKRVEGVLSALGSSLGHAAHHRPEAAAQAFQDAWVGWRALGKDGLVPPERVELAGVDASFSRITQAWFAPAAPVQTGSAGSPGQFGQDVQGITRVLSSWLGEIRKKGSVQDQSWITELQAPLKKIIQAAKTMDVPGMDAAWQDFVRAWNKNEAQVRQADDGAYGTLERKSGLLRIRIGQAGETRGGAAAKEAADLGADMLAVLGRLEAKPSAAWIDAMIIILREGLEAILVIAALLAFLGKTGQSNRRPWVWAGGLAGLGASFLMALGLTLIFHSLGSGALREGVEGITGIVAVLLTLSVGVWLHQKSRIKDWNAWLKARMEQSRSSSGVLALALLAFVAVLREGAETVVFFMGIAGTLGPGDLILGLGLGFLILAVLGFAIIRGSRKLPLHIFFPAAAILMYLLAIKILGQSIAALQSASWVESTGPDWLPSVSLLGIYPTWQTLVPQVLLALVLGLAGLRKFLKSRASRVKE